MTNSETDRLLSRSEAAQYLTSLGYKTAPKTLAKLACIGGSPAYVKFSRKPLYRTADLLSWAEGRTSRLLRSTSDMGANNV